MVVRFRRAMPREETRRRLSSSSAGFLGATPTSAPTALQSYAVIVHDIENATIRGTADTLFYRLLQQAAAVGPAPYKAVVGGTGAKSRPQPIAVTGVN